MLMKTKDLARILNVAKPAEAWSDDSDFYWLAEVLSQLPDVATVCIYAVRIAEGEEAPEPTASVYTGHRPSVGQQAFYQFDELRFFGQPPALTNTSSGKLSILEGPDDSDPNLTAQRRCAFMQVRMSYIIVWFLVYLDKSVTIDRESWANGLYTLVSMLIPPAAAPVRLRRSFLERMVNYSQNNPPADYAEICEAWRDVGKADWCWLWLVNRLGPDRPYELTAAAPPGVIPSSRISPSDGSVAHYACRLGRPVWIEDATIWEQVLDGIDYEVKAAEELERLGAKSFLCIPLFGSQRDEAENDLVSVVTLHYKPPCKRPEHDEDILQIMGSLTARSIRLTQEHEQHDILAELNRLAAIYLTKPARPCEARPDYLEELITLIKKRLRVDYVSLFYRARYERAVECIGTTGLWDVASGDRVPGDALGRAIYRESDANTNTAKCYLNNQPIFTKKASEDSDIKFSERLNLPPRADDFDPTIYVPIPDMLNPNSPPALGVVRCYRHASPTFQGQFASFDRYELETLRFIANQVSAVLSTFEYRIIREQTVTSIKHDLYAPTAMVTDVVHALIKSQESGLPVRAIDLYDLRATTGLMKNMIGHLDPEPTAVRQYRPRPTLLEGDIVARLCDMLSTVAEEYRMGIHYEGFRLIPRLKIDRELIERAVFNLILNAIKYGRRGTRIEIKASISQDKTRYVIDVLNEGNGVADNVPEDYLFLPGYRAPETRELAMGVGLGLTIARAAIESHGGSLNLMQRRGPTIFRIALPISLEG